MAYRVNGQSLLDNGKEFQMFGINFFGFESKERVLHGLWQVNLEQSLDQMKSCGFNCVRLPFRPDVLQNLPISSVNGHENPKLTAMRSLEAFDYVIAALEARKMRYILDHHCAPENIEPLWYSTTYSEAQWLSDLRFVANRYKGRPGFIGLDIKNEPHGSATWNKGNPKTDWDKAANRAFKAIDAVNKDIVLFVEGTALNGANWGGDLSEVRGAPLDIPKDRLIYAAHAYGPSVYPMDEFKASDFPANLDAIWERRFGYLTSLGYMVCPTEIGGTYVGTDKQYLDRYYAWMRKKGITSFFFWCWNANSGDTGGILGLNNDRADFKNVNQAKLKGLKDGLHTSKATFLDGTVPKPAPAPAPSKHKVAVGDTIYASADRRLKFKVTGLGSHAGGRQYVRVSGVLLEALIEK